MILSISMNLVSIVPPENDNTFFETFKYFNFDRI